jgi:LysR family transcriptional regulator, benzoate and cis,cis-muconate-responsive activator of ben and cat genes
MVMADAGIALAAESFRGFSGPELALVPIAGGGPRIVHALAYRDGDVAPGLAALLALVGDE